MSFIHDNPEFEDLLRIVAADRGLGPGLVEKDYWVTHALWALHQQGFEVWFKGGTSLSKGFGLIERFSEDLDLKVEPGVTSLPLVTNWKSEGASAVAARRASLPSLANLYVVPGAPVAMDPAPPDRFWRDVKLRVTYPGRHARDLGGLLRPFVLLEVGHARVTPFVLRDLSSFVHDELARRGKIVGVEDNRPRQVRCVHPLVTLLEKLDALGKRVLAPGAAPATFVRHFEDTARITLAAATLPPLEGYPDVRSLAAEMHAQRQIVAVPRADGPALAPDDSERWRAIATAYGAIEPMYWGRRMSLDESCAAIRAWAAVSLR